jgi:hypothetical protein
LFVLHGLCKSDVSNAASGGNTRTLEFVDFRKYLHDDRVYCCFNLPDIRLSGGVRLKRYKHVLPANYAGHVWTFTDTPYTAAQILDYLFGAGTVNSSWTRSYDSAQSTYPVFDCDFMGGPSLAEAAQIVTDKQGLVFTLQGGALRLVWARKGVGTLPSFPVDGSGNPLSDDQYLGTRLTGHPTQVTVIGDRNLYQVMDIEMEQDWATSWEAYLDFDLLADYVFNNFTDPESGDPYDSISGDAEQYIGRQLANARAAQITLREWVTLTGNSGFADGRLYAGRLRMEMPAALYIATLVHKAFRLPGGFAFTNYGSASVPLYAVDIADKLLCDASHDPANYNPPAGNGMTFDITTPVDSNGYVIVKGFQIGAEAFKNLKPDRFDITQWTDSQSLWWRQPFQIDDSGEGDRFIILDDPAVTSTNLVTKVNGYTVFNATPTISAAYVNAALVLRAEQFLYAQGTSGVNSNESAPGLNYELVASAGGYYGMTEIPYSDGNGAAVKAGQIASALLLNEAASAEGGFTSKVLLGTSLTGVVDRVTVSILPGGYSEQVTFTTEQTRPVFTPERELDRRTVENTLFPGQMELRNFARESELLAAGFKQQPRFARALTDALHGNIGSSAGLSPVIVASGSGALSVGTPLWKTPTNTGGSSPVNTQAVMPASVTSSQSQFAGVTVRDQEDSTKPLRTRASGPVLARVMGPCNPGDPLGQVAAADYLGEATSPATTVGVAQVAISGSSVMLIPVMLGGGGGGSSRWG